jgi:hypothetical protein
MGETVQSPSRTAGAREELAKKAEKFLGAAMGEGSIDSAIAENAARAQSPFAPVPGADSPLRPDHGSSHTIPAVAPPARFSPPLQHLNLTGAPLSARAQPHPPAAGPFGLAIRAQLSPEIRVETEFHCDGLPRARKTTRVG